MPVSALIRNCLAGSGGSTDFEPRLTIYNDLGFSEILAGNHEYRSYLLYIKVTAISSKESKVDAYLRTMNIQYERVFHGLEAMASP